MDERLVPMDNAPFSPRATPAAAREGRCRGEWRLRNLEEEPKVAGAASIDGSSGFVS
jgi:hypothetical protein